MNRTDKRMQRQLYEQMVGDEGMDEEMNEGKNERMDGWMSGQMDGWMDGQMDD